MSAVRKSTNLHYVAEEDLFLARDQRTIVSAGDSRAIFLLARKGHQIQASAVRSLGIDEHTECAPAERPGAPKTVVAVAPEEIVTRARRPEKPSRTR